MSSNTRLSSLASLAAFAAFAGFVSAASTGCMQYPPGEEGPIQLETHVTDWRHEVIYQVIVDRFANGDYGNDIDVDQQAPGRYHGGDWLGLEEHLDYMTELGVTTIWISPVVKNVENDAGFAGYHGYWAQDLTQTNEHFGDLPALRSLVSAAHAKGIKIILDIVTNHLGQLFYYDINENGQPDETVSGNGTTVPTGHISEYDPEFDPRGVQAFSSLGGSGPAPIIFFEEPATNHMPPMPVLFQNPDVFNKKGEIYNFNDPDQLIHGDFPGGLKDVNTTRCDVKQTFVDAYATWVEQTDLDGFRIDTVKHVEREFWRYFSQKMRERLTKDGKKNFIMFGEAFDGRDDLVGSFTLDQLPDPVDLKREDTCVPKGDPEPITGAQLDSVFYFPQYYTAIVNVFQQGQNTQQIQTLWDLKKTDFGQSPQPGGIGLTPTQAMVNFLDNHDVARFLYGGFSTQALRNAFTFMFTAEGIPCVYYGDEQEFNGGNDPANREDFWPTHYATTGETFKWVQKLIALRKKTPALELGDTNVVWSTTRIDGEPDAGIFAFERTGGDAGSAYALVVINTNANHPSAPIFNDTPMKVTAPIGTKLVDVLNETSSSATVGAGNTLRVTVPPTSAVILVPEGQ